MSAVLGAYPMGIKDFTILVVLMRLPQRLVLDCTAPAVEALQRAVNHTQIMALGHMGAALWGALEGKRAAVAAVAGMVEAAD